MSYDASELAIIELVGGFAADMFDAEPELMAQVELAKAGNREAFERVKAFFDQMNEAK